MTERKLDIALLFSFVAAVVVTYFSSPLYNSTANASFLPRKNLLESKPRDPASTQDHVVEEDIFCKNDHIVTHTTSQRQVILQGSNCGDANVEIKNVTNGSSVAYFPFKKNKFKTDLIFLSPGKNKITITQKNAKGSFVSQDLEILSSN